MTPGVAERLVFALLPVSWTLKRGSRLRISLAGADADHFPQVPHGAPPQAGAGTWAAPWRRSSNCRCGRRSAPMIDVVQALCAAHAEPSQPTATFRALDRALQDRVGHRC